MKLVTIVGAGALGSHAAQFLRNSAALRLVDDDRIESKNILSQFHGRIGTGKNKAVALSQIMHMLFGIRPEGIPHRLTEDSVDQLLSGSALVVDCVDNARTRLLIQGFARRTGTPCLHGALAADGAFGLVAWDGQFTPDDDGAVGAATCEGGEHLPFIAMVAAHLARAAQEFLATGRTIGFQVLPSSASVRI